MSHYLLLASLLATFSLAACGTRGSLSLPPGPAPAPILGNPPAAKAKAPTTRPDAPAAQPAGGGDLNTTAPDGAK